jgi:hypothetical protein
LVSLSNHRHRISCLSMKVKDSCWKPVRLGGT